MHFWHKFIANQQKFIIINTTLIILNNGIEELIKLVKSLKDSGLLLKGVTESVQNEIKEQIGGVFSMLLGTLGASLLGNFLTGKGATPTSHREVVNKKGKGIHRGGEGIIRGGEGNNNMDF